MLKSISITGLFLMLTVAGCSRKEPASAPPVQEKAAASVSVDSPTPDAPPPKAAAADPAPTATPAPETDNSVGADLGNVYVSELQSIVDSYYAVTKRKPTDFAQIISAGFLPTMPAAPAGKKYTIDPGTMKVKLANR